MARIYLWPENTWWGNYSHPFALFIALTALIRFSQIFLNTDKYLKITHRVLNGLTTLILPAAAVSFFIPYSYATRLSAFLAGLTALCLIVFAMPPMFRVNRRQAVYYSSSWVFFSLGAILLTLRSYGIIDESFISAWSFQIGAALGSIMLSIGVSDKINSLKQTNKSVKDSLRLSEERYRLFFETANDGIMYVNNGSPVFANKKMIKMTGLKEEEFYQSDIGSFLISDTTDDDNQVDQMPDSASGQRKYESQLVTGTGARKDVLVSVSPIGTDQSSGFFMIITDVSFLKRASLTITKQYKKIATQSSSLQSLNRELVSTQKNLLMASREIEREKEYLSSTLSSIEDGVITYSMDGRIFLMNPVAEKLTGVKEEDAIGKNIRDIVRLKDVKSNEILLNALGKIKDEQSFNNIGMPFHMTGADGVERIVELNSSIIKPDDSPIGIVLALRDITIKQKIDIEIDKMSKLESIGILAGGIAHDFNNLLTGISGNISIAKGTDSISGTFKGILTDIEKAVERAGALTKQLLTFAKGGDPILTPSSITDLINESAKFIIKNPDIKCTINISEDIKPVMIDPNQISQAINNLLINSVQALPEGGKITIEALNYEGENLPAILKNKSCVLIRIKDTGRGISPEMLSKIFDPFFTTKTNGTGLGLTSTYSIIKKHRGHIEVSSVQGEGTIFEIYLKSTDKLPDNEVRKKQKLPVHNEGSILIMDDEQYILEVFSKMLRHIGYNVECTKTGEEAIKMYKEKKNRGMNYDYVILDLTVYGGMGGKETIKKLIELDPEINAVVSSGYSDNPVMANHREYGFRGILKKPYTIDDIVSLFGRMER